MFGLFTRRKQLIIDKPLQMQPVRAILAQGVLLGLAFFVTIYFLSQRFITFFQGYVAGDESAREMFFTQINYIFLAFFFFSFILMLVSSYIIILYTNKIAGPVFNISRALDRNEKENTYYPIRLRQGDLLQDLAEKINKLIDRNRIAAGAPVSEGKQPTSPPEEI